MIIDELPSISIANDSDEIAIEQGTATKKITKGNFLQEIVSSISSLLSSLSGKVSKAGDTMTGDLILQNASCITQDTSITSGTTPSSNIYGRAFYLNDNQRFNIGTWQIMSLANGREGFQLVGAKKVNNVNKYNYIRMLVDANGNPVVELNGAAAWRNALDLGKTHAYLSSTVSKTLTATGTTAALVVLTGNSANKIGMYLIYFASATATPLVKTIAAASDVTATASAGKVVFSAQSVCYIDVYHLYDPQNLVIT